MKSESKSVYIPSTEAKDLWLSNNLKSGVGNGYTVFDKTGKLNLKRFGGSLDYSLDLQKLRKVYASVYRSGGLTFTKKRKEYSRSIMNVDFNYSVKEFNPHYCNGGTTYIRVGYDSKDLEYNYGFKDGLCYVGDELAAVTTGVKYDTYSEDERVLEYFTITENGYTIQTNPTLVTVRELREWLYKNGFVCDGKKFIRYKRSNGSSRIGKCLFIDEKLYPLMNKWQRNGLKPESVDNFDLAGYEAYIALTLSSMIGSVEIYPHNILVVKDYESAFNEDMIVTREVDGWLKSGVENYTVRNCIWDGQSLMDTSLFEGYEEYGMLLLRNRFFKSCCFNTNIQQWFKDNNITEVSQLNGKTLAKSVEDIKLITTPSSIKYIKFNHLSRWLQHLDPTFGIVKHEKPTHNFDRRAVNSHYQLINTLQMTEEEVKQLLEPTVKYMNSLNDDPAVMRLHAKFRLQAEIPRLVKDRNDLIFCMMNVSDKFCDTKLYHDFKRDTINSVKTNAKKGRIIINGNYSTLFGNPVEMLQEAIGTFDGRTQIGIGNVYCKRFEFNKTLLASRSPHVCASNIYLPTNVYNAQVEKYFNLSEQIVVVNSINESLLDRLSGSDFDSDTCMLTDNEILINAARRNYNKFLVPANAVQATKIPRTYTAEQLADLDAKTSVNKIGDIINLAQILTTIFWDRVNSGQTFEENAELYNDIISLDVLSNIEIDKAKREFVIDSSAEINKLRKKYLVQNEDGKVVIPNFLGFIAKKKGYYNKERKAYTYHESSMEYVQKIINKVRFRQPKPYMPLSDMLKSEELSISPNYKQKKSIIDFVRKTRPLIIDVWSDDKLPITEKYNRHEEIMEDRLWFLKTMKLNSATIRLLIKSIESKKCSDIRRELFYLLFHTENENFYDELTKMRCFIPELISDEQGTELINYYKFKRTERE